MRRLGWRVSPTWAGLAFLALVTFLLFVHPFLALDAPVAADVLVVEGWVPRYVLDRAVSEIQRGAYGHVFVSGLYDREGKSDAEEAVVYLVAATPGRASVVAAPATDTGWNRTSRMARAVRDGMRSRKITPRGVNVLTLGPHGRQSLLAYSRMLGPALPVGVITVPKDDYDPRWWWLSPAGIKKTTKDFAGWIRELLFGLRS